jgi:hypothetical protein
MDHVAKALPDGLHGSTQRLRAEAMTSTANTALAEPQPAPVMCRLWHRMGAIYGHRWSSAYGEDATARGEAGEVWAKGLAGLTARQIGDGISAAMASADPWPPTLPEFRALCLGIPAFATVAHQIARPAPEQSRFVRLVWQYIDGWRFGQASTQESERMLRSAYEVAREHVMRGGALPEPSPAIEAPKPRPIRPASEDVVRTEMQRIADALGAGSTEDPAAPAVSLGEIEAELAAHYGAVSDVQAEVDAIHAEAGR